MDYNLRGEMWMWGYIILIFAGMWITQIIFSSLQMKHYRDTLRALSSEYKSGFLGVGVDKKKIGVGTVIIIVTDSNGIIIESKKMEGVTVFQRFTPYPEILNKSIYALENDEHTLNSLALTQAIEQVKKIKEK